MQIVMVGLGVFGIASLMEWYKKNIRKDQAKVWEIRLVSAALSIVAAIGYKVTGLFTPVITYFFTQVTVLVDVALYAVVIWLLQLQADMGILKAIVKVATNRLPTGEAILTDEMKRRIKVFEVNTRLDVDLVIVLLRLAGFTKDTVRKALAEIGVDEDKIDRIVDAFDKAKQEKLPETTKDVE